MHKFLISLLFIVYSSMTWADTCPPLLNQSMIKLRSSESINFCQAFKNKVILAVNTASNCGFTPQFKGLEALYKKYKDAGLVVLGFPSDDFKQEFADAEKTATMCYRNYGVSFPMFATGPVSGSDANPFFKQLSNMSDTRPKWNFYKYLINRKGDKVEAFNSLTEPQALESAIVKLLAE